jgi:hypothetical protein
VKLVATYPIDAEVIKSCCGQPVLAQTIHGDVVVGVLDRVEDGMAYFKPLSLPEASVQTLHENIRKKAGKLPKRKGKKSKKIVILNSADGKKAKTAAFGFPWYGGFGYGGYGYGAGLALALPLFLLAALFVSPFLWW